MVFCTSISVCQNGLACAPRMFTKLLKPVFSTLIKNGHTVLGYIDDTFLQGDTFAECQTAAVSLFSELGFVVHNEISEILPKQEIHFLGFTLNSVTMTVSITPERKCKTKQTIQGLLNAPFITIRELAEVIGILVANLPGVTYGRLYYIWNVIK